MSRILGVFLGAVAAALVLVDCSANLPETSLDYKSRATSRSEGGVRVSTAVLSADESAAVYGVPLATRSIQPVWIEIENREDRGYYLLSPGLDPNFFPASEASEAVASMESPDKKEGLDRRFQQLAFHNPVLPGATTSGFVLTNLDEGFKLVQIDLVSGGRARTFSILSVVPGFRSDYRVSEVFRRNIYASEEILNYTDDDAFRTALEALPCCVTNKDASKNGDPLNLVVVGGLDDAFPAFARRGWRPTEQKWSGSITKMVTSALAGERYAYAPVSDLYMFGRPQDLALQKARDNIHQRNHLRLRPVYISSILIKSYNKLARIDSRNDSQVIFYDQVIPGSTLVGYVNADHWALAVPIARTHSIVGSMLVTRNAYPREALVEAILRFVEADLSASPEQGLSN